MSVENSIITMGDTNYFPTIALSALQARKLHPECKFAVYDWGFTDGERRFLRDEAKVITIDWRTQFVDIALPSSIMRIWSILTGGAPLRVKQVLLREAINDLIKNGRQGKEWLLAQKPYALLDWSNRVGAGGMLFLDGDAFLMGRIDEVWDDQCDMSVTVRRENEINFAYGHCQVINTGVLAFNGNPRDRGNIIQGWIDRMQEKFEYLIEQSAMTRLVFEREQQLVRGGVKEFVAKAGCYSARILDCDTYNYNWIEEGVDPTRNKVVHFKGGRHSGERFWQLAKELGFERELEYISRWHGVAS